MQCTTVCVELQQLSQLLTTNMNTRNYIFQIQNAIYNTIHSGNFGVEIILNRGISVPYQHIIIVGTKKMTQENLQTSCTTEIQLNTKDVSLLNTVQMLTNIEEILTSQNIRENLNFYSLQFCEILSCEVTTSEDGHFCGKIFLRTLMD